MEADLTESLTRRRVPHMIEATNSILQFFLGLGSNDPAAQIIGQFADVTITCLGAMRWRRCTALLLQQRSDKGTRYLAYLDTKIVHHGGSFGTDCSAVTRDAIVKDVVSMLKKMKFCAAQSKEACELHRELMDLKAKAESIESKYLEQIQSHVDQAFGF